MKPIWIVDDDQSIRFVLEKALLREDLPTRSFTHPREVLQALEAAGEHDGPQVLVSDIRMPGGSGLDLLRAMRGREVTYYTALCLIDGRNDSVQSDTAIVRVTFRDLGDDEIEQYLLAEQPYDVAGSAKCEGLGISLLERIDSDGWGYR